MTGMQAALIEAHEKNIRRYAQLLATDLTDLERGYLHRRIAEERLAIEQVAGVDLHMPPPAAPAETPHHL